MKILEESGVSSVHEEVDGEPKHRPGLPNSPSSSGGFRQFSSKGLCREGMSGLHYFDGKYGIYARHIMLCCPQNLFSDCRVCLWSWEHSYRTDRAIPMWYFEWVPICYALFRCIKAFCRFLVEIFLSVRMSLGFISIMPPLTSFFDV